MRAGSIASEAWRNVISGTTRAAVWAGLFFVLVTVLAGADSLVVARLITAATQYRSSGASTLVVRSIGGIDGRTCEALSEMELVTGSGAVRQDREPIALEALPGASIPHWEATAGLQSLLTAHAVNPGDVLLSAGAAAQAGVAAGSPLISTTGPIRVNDIYDYPEDGRQPELGYAVVTQAPADGVFDQCWIDVWPQDASLAPLSRVVLREGPSGVDQVTITQLNQTLGEVFTGPGDYRSRITRFAPLLAFLVALLLGAVSVLTRKTELATALHFGVTRSGLVAQLLLESLSWIIGGVLLAAPFIVWVARAVPDLTTLLLPSATTLALACVAAILGVCAACLTVRERALFTYQRQ